MSQKQRIKILDYKYHEGANLVYLDVTSEAHPNPLRLAISSIDFTRGFGIAAEVSPDLMRKFLKDLKGKEINWVTELHSVEATDAKSESSIEEALETMDTYPFHEIQQVEEQ
jgi:hypothetical protein